MHFIIRGHISEEEFTQMEDTTEPEIALDLDGVYFLTSREINRLLLISKTYNRTLSLKDANDHICETIRVLNLEKIFKMEN